MSLRALPIQVLNISKDEGPTASLEKRFGHLQGEDYVPYI